MPASGAEAMTRRAIAVGAQRLRRGESDAVARLAKIATLAEQVFGERTRARRWLRSPKKAFRGRCPIEMLGSSEGTRLVEEALLRLDEGYFA
jgi:putative toxin-antitoxin system antitoxin component (TIGR02293 family)